MYRVHSNGTVYRIQYSVSETAYQVERGDTVVAQWSDDDSLSIIGDTHYAPIFEQDAGEHGSSIGDYKIIILNALEHRKESKVISISINKTWPGTEHAASPDTFAQFELRRYVHQEYRDYSNVGAGTEWVEITLDTWGDGTRQQKLTVPAGTTMHIVGNIKPQTNANPIRFSQSSGEDNLELVQNNPDESLLGFDITFVADQTKTIRLTQGDNYVMGGRDGFRLSDTYGNKTTDVLDITFADDFTLNNANGWSRSFAYLPVIEETDIDPAGGTQTIYVYSYYLTEIACKPPEFVPRVMLSEGSTVTYIDQNNRIVSDAVIIAENTEKTVDITVIKESKDDIGKTDPVPLKGATFRLEKYTSDTFQQKDSTWIEQTISDSGQTGVFNFTGLTVGYYKIVEVDSPDGYVKISADPTFEVKSGGSGALEVVFTDTNLVKYSAETGFRFGNEPGTALPNTGGPGEQSLETIGGLLMAATFILLVMRKRRLMES